LSLRGLSGTGAILSWTKGGVIRTGFKEAACTINYPNGSGARENLGFDRIIRIEGEKKKKENKEGQLGKEGAQNLVNSLRHGNTRPQKKKEAVQGRGVKTFVTKNGKKKRKNCAKG